MSWITNTSSTSTLSTPSYYIYGYGYSAPKKVIKKKKVKKEIKQMPADLILFDPKELVLCKTSMAKK
ncbi:MAG: hypothetical protein ACTSX1_06625 [Candidatus Heimdallarchaeaceae archaeon]